MGVMAVSEKEVRIRGTKIDAFDFIDRNNQEITKIGDAIFYFAELGMQEFRTSEYAIDALRKAGFDVEVGIAGMPTAWIATWGSGKPVVAVMFEGDALPNSSQVSGIPEEKPIIAGAPGHAEGHNTNVAVTLGAAVAVKTVMENKHIPGTIKLFFGPAEEQFISRPYMLRDGYFEGVDAIFHPHLISDFSTMYGIRQYANIAAEFIFHGRSASSRMAPWMGKNALDAVTLMDVGWSLMRQQLEPSQRSHRAVLAGGDQASVIPKYAKMEWGFTNRTMELAQGTFEKAKKIAEGAAIMTGCTYEVNILSTCWPTRANQTMAEIIQKNMEMVGMPKWSEEEETLAKTLQKKIDAPIVGLQKKIKLLRESKQRASSNDSGCVTWVIPCGFFYFPANIPGCEFHSWPAGVSLVTTIAHKAEINGAKVLAASMIDLFCEEVWLLKVKQSFKEEIGDAQYFDVMPHDQKPPVDLNREQMERWRPLMKKLYIRKKVHWK